MSAWHQGIDQPETYPSFGEAQRAAEDSLDWARDYASDEGWPDEVERVACGIVVQQVVETARGDGRCYGCSAETGQPCEPGCDGDRACAFDEYIEYELRDVPDLAERIAEVLSTRPAVWEQVQRLVAVGTEPLVDREATSDEFQWVVSELTARELELVELHRQSDAFVAASSPAVDYRALAASTWLRGEDSQAEVLDSLADLLDGTLAANLRGYGLEDAAVLVERLAGGAR